MWRFPALADLNDMMHDCPEICTLTCSLGESYGQVSLRNSLTSYCREELKICLLLQVDLCFVLAVSVLLKD